MNTAVPLISGNKLQLFGRAISSGLHLAVAFLSEAKVAGTGGLAKQFRSGSVVRKTSHVFTVTNRGLRMATGSAGGKPKHSSGQFTSNKSNGKKQFAVFSLTQGAVNGDLAWIELAMGEDAGHPDYLEAVAYGIGDSTSVTVGPVPEPQASRYILVMLALAGAGSALQAWRKRRLAS